MSAPRRRSVLGRFGWLVVLSLGVAALVAPVAERAGFEDQEEERLERLAAMGGQDRPAGPPAIAGVDGPLGQPPDGVPGVPFVLSPVETRTMADIAAEQQTQDLLGTPALPTLLPPEFEVPGRRRLKNDPRSPDVASWPPGAPDRTPGAPFVLTPGTTIEGPTLAQTSAFPPDTMGDVGPTQYFITLNGRMRVYNKTTTAQEFDVAPDTFFSAAVRNNAGTTDPRIRFDRLSQRWFIVYITVAIPNRLVIATSSTATISGATVWTYAFVNNTVTNGSGQGCLGDYETLGIDAHALYMGVNQFCGTSIGSATFFNTSAFVVNKANLIAGAGTVTLISPLISGLPRRETCTHGPLASIVPSSRSTLVFWRLALAYTPITIWPFGPLSWLIGI